MSKKTKINFNSKGLERVARALKKKIPKVRVGIMGDGAARSDDDSSGVTNAQIGVYHEFGTENMPIRSFLRMPMEMKFDENLEASQIFDRAILNRAIVSGNVMPIMERVAIVAEQTVLEAFDTDGYGQWPPTADNYENNTGQILVDTTQLRDSITSKVVK